MAGHSCEFHYDYPFPHQDIDPGCQFNQKTETFSCDGKDYCRFHLPLTDEAGTGTEKAVWDEAQCLRFHDDIKAHIAAAVEQERPANLTGVAFPGKSVFEGTTFPMSLCYHVTFEDLASYRNANFSGGADFSDATFSGGADFSDADFSGIADFSDADFSGIADFGGATFSRIADFSDATFSGDVGFDGATFSGDADFSWTPHESHPAADEEEKKAKGPDGGSNAFHRFYFREGRTAGVANFNNRVFTETTDFQGQVFEKPPKFHNATLHQETKWRGAVFRGAATEDAEDDYRTLRLAMDVIKNRRQEGVFIALEQEAMRHQAKWWELRAVASHLYDLSCRYGQSISRPLAWLLGFTVLFGLVYLAASGVRWVDWAFASDLTSFTLRQVVKPFTVWGREIDELIAPFHGGLSIWVKVLATLQSLISLGLFALFLLALRWQFRRA